MTSCSPPSSASRLIHVTSIAASPLDVPGQAFDPFVFMTRHTCATLLAALDVHPWVAMRIMRHSQIAITMDVYTHVPSEETRDALKRLGDSLGRVQLLDLMLHSGPIESSRRSQ
jgi:integrase